ncbi:hypothetical protein [Pseudonocardia xishanensis]|uniref:Mobilization protein MobC n=1 Tax=Pseudonocardia xishanensis TaxID=630995 RepID=A0ABP8S0X0_9PSEU
MTGPSRRARAEGGRPHKVSVQFSDLEMALVTTAAVRSDMAPGAWLGEVGVRAAETVPGPASQWGPTMQSLMQLRAELMEHRRVLRNVGGNLNDVARHANADGELHEATGRVQDLVGRVVERIERTVGEVDELAKDARRERLRPRS